MIRIRTSPYHSPLVHYIDVDSSPSYPTSETISLRERSSVHPPPTPYLRDERSEDDETNQLGLPLGLTFPSGDYIMCDQSEDPTHSSNTFHLTSGPSLLLYDPYWSLVSPPYHLTCYHDLDTNVFYHCNPFLPTSHVFLRYDKNVE